VLEFHRKRRLIEVGICIDPTQRRRRPGTRGRVRHLRRLGLALAFDAIVILALGLLSIGHPARAAENVVEIAGLHVAIWRPAGGAPSPPVLVFSHGFHGCSTQSRFLMEAFAAAGYLVLAPNHRDAVCGRGEAHWRDRPEVPFRHPESWSDSSYRDRADDLRALVEAARRDPQLQADWERLGLVGHSLGGYTVLGLAGAWPSWKLPGVKAVLALSPFSQPFLSRATLAGLSAPVMYQGGTLDLGITPWIDRAAGAYAQSPGPKYLVEFAGAAHFAWADVGRRAHAPIVAYSLAFLDHYLKRAPADPRLTHGSEGVALLRYDSEPAPAASEASTVR